MADQTKANEPSPEKTFDDLTTIEEKVNWHYQRAQGSIQDIARVYHLSVEEVLRMLNLDDMVAVQTQGDLIDQSEAGPEVNVNPFGNPARAKYTTD